MGHVHEGHAPTKALLDANGKPDHTKHQVLHNPDGTATVTDLTVVDISQPSRKSRNFGNAGLLKGSKKGLGSGLGSVSRKGLATALPARVDALLDEAMTKRSVGCTALNEQSSRSHMVFTMKLDGVNEARGKRAIGVLNLIDLAGSERVKDSGSTGIRLKEAQAINTSLSALGESRQKCPPGPAPITRTYAGQATDFCLSF